LLGFSLFFFLLFCWVFFCSSLGLLSYLNPSSFLLSAVSRGGSQHKRRTASSGGRTGDVVSSSSAAAAELIYDRVMDCLLRLLYVYVCVCV
jgi:hypothetical protein